MQNLNFDIKEARLIRIKRAEIKKRLKSGNLKIQQLFDEKYQYKYYINNMKLYDIIKSLPGFGKVNTEKLMKKLKINFCKRLRGLSTNQKKRFFQYFNI